MNTIEKLKLRREELWSDLDSLLRSYKGQEKEIRDEIRKIQDTLYHLEVSPVVDTIKDEMVKSKVRRQLSIIESERETYLH